MSKIQKKYQSRYPYTSQLGKEYPFATNPDVEKAVVVAQRGFQEIQRTVISQRCEVIRRFGQNIAEKRDDLAQMITQFLGVPISHALFEIDMSVALCQYYSDNAERLLTPRKVPTDPQAGKCYVRYDPIGVILIIIPYTQPLFILLQQFVPNYMLGNSALIKVDESCPCIAEEIVLLAQRSGLTKELQILYFTYQQIEGLIMSSKIEGISFTGQTETGYYIEALAQQSRKRCALFLSASDPFIVLQDADLQIAIEKLLISRLLNTGQLCTAPKRIFVHDILYTPFRQALSAAMQYIQPGDPMDPECKLGVLPKQSLVERLNDQIQRSKEQGAKVDYGGNFSGQFFDPTILSDVTVDMPCFTEETIGPLFPIIKFRTEEELLGMINQQQFGLGAVIITANPKRVQRTLVPRIRAGMVFINQYVTPKINAPFGGELISGVGRSLGFEGLKEFANIKTVFVGNNSRD